MKHLSTTARVLILYLVFMIAGQAIAVGIGLLLDPYSKTLALSVFIPLYYAMYWVAWRVALFVGENPRRPRRIRPAARATPAPKRRPGCWRLRCWHSISAIRLKAWLSNPVPAAGIRRGPLC